MKLKGLLPIIFAAAFALVSCQETEPEVPAEITIDKTEIEMPRKAIDAQVYVNITSNCQWTATTDADWLSIGVSQGEANKTYKALVKAMTNTTTEVREGKITITSGKTTKDIKVTQSRGSITLTKDQIPDYDKIYVPKEYEGENFLSSEGKWFFGRSQQSEHFIVFWEPGWGEFGDTTPTQCTSSTYKVDIDDLLDWAEKCFDKYVKTLQFATLGKSILDTRKIDIFLQYSTTWAAYGSGLENNVGCLWINPDAAHYHSTVAHEIGHSFQYIVGCDLLHNKTVSNVNTAAFRYDVGQGNGFWEQTSQWMASVMCPEEAFGSWNFSNSDKNGYCESAYKHLLHEDNRYSSYFIHYYWTDKRGIDCLSNVWKSARNPKDALQAYMEYYNISNDEFNAEVYDYAARTVTWDFNDLKDNGTKYMDKMPFKATKQEDGSYKVDASVCPEATGFNIIRLQNYTKGKDVVMSLKGLPNETGYNKSGTASEGGWTIGFVVLSSDGSTRYYSPSVTASANTNFETEITWTVPSDTKRLYAVVAVTPTKYISHQWDENNSNDRLWPYQFSVSGASPKMN